MIEETTEMQNKGISSEQMIANVSKLLDSNRLLFVISINYYPILSELCNIYHIPYVSIVVDSPLLELYSDTIKNEYNRVFIFDRALYNRHVNDNPDCIFHMPLVADLPHINRVLNANTDDSYKSDVAFIGSLYSEKCPYNDIKIPDMLKGYMDGLIESQLKIYGYNFIYDLLDENRVNEFMEHVPIYKFPEKSRHDYKAVIAYNYLAVKVSELERRRYLKEISEKYSLDIYTGSDTSEMPLAHNRGFAKSLTQMPLIFNQSKINLQITARTIETGLSQRVWDVLSSRGFLIMNYQEEIFDYFEVGKDIEVYTSKEELLDKIGFYLENDDVRVKIAQSGYEKVHQYHTPEIRLGEMMKRVI